MGGTRNSYASDTHRGDHSEFAGKSEHNTLRVLQLSSLIAKSLGVPYSVHFGEEVDAPADLRARVFELLIAIAETMETIPSESAFWTAANSAGLAELSLGGWKFEYRIHHGDRRILVLNARWLGGKRVV